MKCVLWGEQMEKPKQHKRKFKKQHIAIILAVVAFTVVVVQAALAYLSDDDEVTNVMQASDIEIKLFEPAWYSTGLEDAAYAEPGMVIAKDPYVTNVSDTAVYVRMKITLTDADGNDITARTDTSDNADSSEDSENSEDSEDNSESSSEDGRYEKILAALLYSYEPGDDGTLTSSESEFLFDTDEDEDSETYGQLLLTNTNMNNPYFYYDADNGWFYYIGPVDSDGNNTDSSDNSTTDSKPTELAALDSGASTQKLFTGFRIPVLKADYTDYFDTEFHIVVTAQAISVNAVTVEAGESGYFDAVVAAFTSTHGN